MFVKKNTRTVKGKEYTYYFIAETYRLKDRKHPTTRTLANISHLPMRIIEQIMILLKKPGAAVVEDINEFFKESRIYGPIMFFYLLMKQMKMLKALEIIPFKSRILIIAIIINRILDPRSKLGSVEWIKKSAFGHMFGISGKKLVVNQIYKSMDVFHKRIDKVMDEFFKDNQEGTNFFLYDITSVFFEGKGPERISKRGYSRDKRRDRPQILVALCLNEKGLPVHFEIFEGNLQDKQTVIPLIDEIKKKYEVEKCTFIGDRGMVTADNLDEIVSAEMDYIVALKHKEARALLWEKKSKEPELFDKEVPVTIFEEEEEEEEEEKEKKRYVLCGSQFRKEHDLQVLDAIIKREKETLEHVRDMVSRGVLKKKDVVIKRAQKKLTKANKRKNFHDFEYQNGKFKIIEDTEYIEMSKNLCGYYILETTITQKQMKDEEVENNYKELKHLEKAFEELKDVVEIRPIYHWKERRVKTHVFLCILAQTLVNRTKKVLKEKGWLRKKKEYSFNFFLDELSEIKLGVFDFENTSRKVLTQIKAKHNRILKMFDMNPGCFKNPFNPVVE